MQSITKLVSEHFGGKRALLWHACYLGAFFGGRFRKEVELDLAKIDRLVFVCKGNICRSAFAHATALHMGLPATSFGLDTPGNESADAVAIRNAAIRGINLRIHRTTSARMFRLESGDLLVAMEPEQAARLRVLHPHTQVTVLGLWTNPKRPFIQDPYGRGDAYFQRCFKLIESGVAALAGQIKSCRKLS